MSEDGLKQCYNKGCLAKFREEDDSETACKHHPGVPVFHDALKGWSCCKKRTTDFTDFLNIPGCTVGKHNSVKPPETEKVKETPLPVGEEIVVKAPLPQPMQPKERPADDLPKDQLKVGVAHSLHSLLAQLKKQEEEEGTGEEEEVDKSDNGEVKIGTICKNKACQMVFTGEDANLTQCQFHSGFPIFHEGYKFWSCCQKRTSDFNEFLKQEGCTHGEHVWTEEVAAVTCRYDWHQTGSHVVVAFYAKACFPEQCVFEANQTSVHVVLSFNNGKCQQMFNFKLFGLIDPARSSAELLGAKAEVKLRKAAPLSWSSLELKTETKQTESDKQQQDD